VSGGDLVAIGYITEGSQDFHFTLSLDDAMRYDAEHEQQLAWPPIRNQSGVDLSLGRNQVVEAFLGTEAQWLLFIDTDMGFAPDAISRLRASADPETRPVVGGLCFGIKRAEITAEHGYHVNPHPTLYQWVERESDAGFSAIVDYQRDTVQQVHGTGAAFLLIHRSVLERMGAEQGPRWFSLAGHPKAPQGFSEDMSFCLRLLGLGIPLFVDTSVKTCHAKKLMIDEWCFDNWPRLRPPCDVVIPVKDHLEVTQGIIEQLSVHPGVGNVYVFDNGSGPETADYLRSQTFAKVIDAAGLNIHQMWNQGLDLCTPGRPVAVLNNDLRLGPEMFLRTLEAMENGLSVVCPNYDGRPGVGIERVHGICAGRYDGTGGLAGFAMFLNPLVASTYRFPEELEWWGGDNDLCSWLESEGLAYGIALGASVEHLDGGSVTFRELEGYDPTEDLRLMNERIEARHA